MDHRSRSDEAGFAGYENDSARVPLQHPRKIGPRQPRSAEHVDLEVPAPIVVGDVGEILDLVDAQIVDEDIHEGRGLQESRSTFRRRRVGKDATHVGAACGTNVRGGFIELRSSSAGDRHLCTFDGELPGDRKTNTSGRASDQCRLAVQLQVHGGLVHLVIARVFARRESRHTTEDAREMALVAESELGGQVRYLPVALRELQACSLDSMWATTRVMGRRFNPRCGALSCATRTTRCSSAMKLLPQLTKEMASR